MTELINSSILLLKTYFIYKFILMKKLFTYSITIQAHKKYHQINIFPFSDSANQSSFDLEKIDFQQKEKILKVE